MIYVLFYIIFLIFTSRFFQVCNMNKTKEEIEDEELAQIKFCEEYRARKKNKKKHFSF